MRGPERVSVILIMMLQRPPTDQVESGRRGVDREASGRPIGEKGSLPDLSGPAIRVESCEEGIVGGGCGGQ